jgi:hypothetical protein
MKSTTIIKADLNTLRGDISKQAASEYNRDTGRDVLWGKMLDSVEIMLRDINFIESVLNKMQNENNR